MDGKVKPRALIIGGSLGGLFAATTLRAIGWDVAVFERSAHALNSRGGGVVLQAEVLAAFQFAGLKYVGPLGIASRDRIFLGREDQIIHCAHMPQTQSSWNKFYGVLRRGLPDAVVHSGEQFIRFEQSDQKVSAYFASGRIETGDLLIGADGPHSAVRRHLLPDIAPRYAGYVAWRGLVPETELAESAQQMLRGAFAFQQGAGHMLLEYMVPGQNGSTAPGERRWNWIWYRKVEDGSALDALLTDAHGKRHGFSMYPGSVKQQDIGVLRREAKTMAAPTFQRLLEATDEPFLQAILDLEVPQMVSGRVILTGDAAFIPRPHTAGSTAKAAANAQALAESLSREGRDIDAALQHWERTQLDAGRKMVRWGIDAGERIMSIRRAVGDAA